MEERNQPKPVEQEVYAEKGNLEAHIIADMLRIESITTELREFKDDTKQRLNKFYLVFIGSLIKIRVLE